MRYDHGLSSGADAYPVTVFQPIRIHIAWQHIYRCGSICFFEQLRGKKKMTFVRSHKKEKNRKKYFTTLA